MSRFGASDFQLWCEGLTSGLVEGTSLLTPADISVLSDMLVRDEGACISRCFRLMNYHTSAVGELRRVFAWFDFVLIADPVHKLLLLIEVVQFIFCWVLILRMARVHCFFRQFFRRIYHQHLFRLSR